MSERPMATDWRALLGRYMAKVVDRDGETHMDRISHGVELTEAELALLREVLSEVRRGAFDGQNTTRTDSGS